MLLIKNLRIFYNIICYFNAQPLIARLFSINTKSSVMRIFSICSLPILQIYLWSHYDEKSRS